jgi:hypothetical protein
MWDVRMPLQIEMKGPFGSSAEGGVQKTGPRPSFL